MKIPDIQQNIWGIVGVNKHAEPFTAARSCFVKKQGPGYKDVQYVFTHYATNIVLVTVVYIYIYIYPVIM